MQTSLNEMQAGKSGIVVKLLGGHGLTNRLNALGIRMRKKITKENSMLMHGPAVITVGHTRIAVGHSMAKRIIVEVADENPTNGQP